MNKTVSIVEYEALKADYNALLHELNQLKKMIFGSKTERFIPAQHPEQLGLDFGDQPVVEIAKETITYQRRKKKHPGRTALPENIPTKDVIIEPAEDTTGMKLIGQEVTETIDYKPGVLLKIRYIRPKFFDAQKHHPVLAQYGLKEIQKLYAIERACTEAGYTTEQRQEKRDHKARPIFDELLKWVNTEQLNNLSKGPIGTALFYTSHQLPKLSAYLDDGRILIDNNLIENARCVHLR